MEEDKGVIMGMKTRMVAREQDACARIRRMMGRGCGWLFKDSYATTVRMRMNMGGCG